MIYLKDGNIPLNLAYDDDIVQEANSTYQLSFKFPLTDGKWNLLKREVFLLADDLHGEQEFFIFEVKKAKGHVQVYAKQVATLLNYYSIDSISVDRVPGQTAMTALAGSIKRNCPFTFFSDIMDRHTFNESNVSVMDALVKDKHSIVGQWGGDLVRDKYQVKLLKNGGIENESLFMYKKNLSSYEESENISNLKTRLHLKKVIKGQTEAEADRVIAVTVDSPLIGQYRQIYEADIEVNDQDVTDEATLTAYGQRYFSSTLCDLVENSINLDVKGKSDVSVKMFDTVSVFHERFDVDLRLKITSYHFGPMSKRLKSIGFGKVSQTFGSTVASMVAGSVDKATGRLSASFEQKLQKEIDNANRHFDAEFDKRVEVINDGIEQSKAEAEAYADTIKQKIDAEIDAVNQSMQAQSEEHDRQVADILSKTQSVESLANQTKADAANALSKALRYKNEAIAEATRLDTVERQATETKLATAKSQAIAEATRFVETAKSLLSGQISNVSTDLSQTKEAIKLLATKENVDTLTGRVSSAEAMIQVQADQISQRIKTSDFDQAKQRLNSAESSIIQLGNRITTEISEVSTKLDNFKVGSRNYAEDYDFSRGLWEYSQEDSSPRNINFTNGVYTLTTTTNSWHQLQIHSESGSRKGGKVDSTALLEPKVGETYTLSVEVKHNSGSPNFWLELRDNGLSNYNAVVTHLGGSRNVITATSEWVRYSVTGTIKPNSDFGHRRIILGYNGIGSISFRKVELTQSYNFTDAGPAPEDALTEIENAKTTIAQTASGMEQLSTKLTKTADKVTSAETNIRQLVNEVASKVSQTDYNTLTGRVDDAETAITQNAQEISKRLTKTQVDKAITDKGYATVTVVENKVKETADSFSRTISETKALIPSELSGNLLLKSDVGWSNVHDKNYVLADKLEKGKTYTLVSHYWHGEGATGHTSTIGDGAWNKLSYNPAIDSWMVTFQAKADIPAGHKVYLASHPETALGSSTFVTLVKGAIPLSRWEPAFSEFATVTALHNVTDTIDSHTRTIGAVGTAGSILDNISKVTQTAAGLVQEVSGTNGLKTQVGQLKNSWAVKISGPEGLKTAINASEDGVRFKGKNLWLDGNTLIDNAVITSAMIAGLDAGKITTGTLDAARIKADSIDGSKMVFDQAFVNKMTANTALFRQLFAQDAFITSVQAVAISAKQIAGGIAKALNGGMDVNFDESKINFYTNVAAIRRIYTGHPTQFIKFETEGNYSRTIIGSNRNGGEVFNSATFAGIVVENTNNINTEDNVRIYGDNTLLRHAQGDVGWNINSVTQRIVPANINAESEIWSKHFVAPDKNSKPVRLDTAVAALWDIWNHIIYNNFEFNEALRTHIKARRDNWKFELNL